MSNKEVKKTYISPEEAEKLLKGNARDMLKETSKLGINFDDLKFNIKKNLIQEIFNISDEDLDAVDFVFWLAYFVERIAEELIIDPQVHIGAQKPTMEILVAQLSFGAKITVIEKLYMSERALLLKIMRKIQNLRNSVAHGRFDELKYDGKPLNKGEGQIIIISDIRDAYREVKK